jgi:hypothetical protein
MNNYRNIAAIFIRIMALTMLFYAVLDLGILLTGILLISLEIIPREQLAHEIYLVQIIFFFLGGAILYGRSKSLAKSIVDGLLPDEKEAETED